MDLGNYFPTIEQFMEDGEFNLRHDTPALGFSCTAGNWVVIKGGNGMVALSVELKKKKEKNLI